MPGEISRDTRALMAAILQAGAPDDEQIHVVRVADALLVQLGYTVERPMTPARSYPLLATDDSGGTAHVE